MIHALALAVSLLTQTPDAYALLEGPTPDARRINGTATLWVTPGPAKTIEPSAIWAADGVVHVAEPLSDGTASPA